MNLAALAALHAGDMENALTALTSGGIEAQEARGQTQFVNSATLPKQCMGCTREQIEAMGIVFGNDADDLFVHVTLPAGWRKEATDHSMWSKLLDDKGRERAAIFYKAAFYDRSAHMSLNHCIIVSRRYYDETSETDAYVSSADDGVLFETRRVVRCDWTATDAIESEAHAWADARYPDRRNPAAYWA